MKEFLSKLSPATAKRFNSILPVSKISIEDATEYLTAAAEVIFGGDIQESLYQLGLEDPKYNYSGVYRPLLRILTVPFLISQAARLWSNFHDKGEGRVENNPKEKVAIFRVINYPELPKNFRTFLRGAVAGLSELSGAKNVKVTCDDHDSMAWSWIIRYD
ncbi:hypothetical protein JW933_06235 [candidate division FCPU426 bacterium]|nr:hypothetical protein [candidate division FCPU426 bacterium]